MSAFDIFLLTFCLYTYIISCILIGNECIIVVNLSSYRKKESPAESFFKINELVNFNTGASHLCVFRALIYLRVNLCWNLGGTAKNIRPMYE